MARLADKLFRVGWEIGWGEEKARLVHLEGDST
jgi:hypothetical protein